MEDVLFMDFLKLFDDFDFGGVIFLGDFFLLLVVCESGGFIFSFSYRDVFKELFRVEEDLD